MLLTTARIPRGRCTVYTKMSGFKLNRRLCPALYLMVRSLPWNFNELLPVGSNELINPGNHHICTLRITITPIDAFAGGLLILHAKHKIQPNINYTGSGGTFNCGPLGPAAGWRANTTATFTRNNKKLDFRYILFRCVASFVYTQIFMLNWV